MLISPIFCGIHEASFGTEQVKFLATGDPAGVAAGQLTLRVIRETLASLGGTPSGGSEALIP